MYQIPTRFRKYIQHIEAKKIIAQTKFKICNGEGRFEEVYCIEGFATKFNNTIIEYQAVEIISLINVIFEQFDELYKLVRCAIVRLFDDK